MRQPTNDCSIPTAAFPTEQAVRQKEKKKSGATVGKRKQTVEQHADDMGDDLSSIAPSLSEVHHFNSLKALDENCVIGNMPFMPLLITT